jgi:hypothetical protein
LFSAINVILTQREFFAYSVDKFNFSFSTNIWRPIAQPLG